MKLTAFKGEVRRLGAGAGGIFAPQGDNLVVLDGSGKLLSLRVPGETVAELRIGQRIVVTFETEEPIEAPADIPEKASRAATVRMNLDQIVRGSTGRVSWDLQMTIDGGLPERVLLTTTAGERVVFVPEGGDRG